MHHKKYLEKIDIIIIALIVPGVLLCGEYF